MGSFASIQSEGKKIVILGAGGHGKELASYLHDLVKAGEKIQLVGFVDEKKPKGDFAGAKIFGNFADLKEWLHSKKETVYYITAAGDNEIRAHFVKQIENIESAYLYPWTLCHPKAYLGQQVLVGEGTSLCPGAVVTTHVTIGRHCIVNVNASLSHDVTLGDFTNINPGVRVCGYVKIGKFCYLGAGATIIDRVAIGDHTVIGAGAVVTKDIPSHVTAVGVPARVIMNSHAPSR